MQTIIHENPNGRIAEVAFDQIIIRTYRDALDLMVAPSIQGAKKIIVRRENLVPEFFDLRTGLLGEVLQKFVTYQVRLAVVGDFSDLQSKNWQAFMLESNRGRQFVFVTDVETARKLLAE